MSVNKTAQGYYKSSEKFDVKPKITEYFPINNRQPYKSFSKTVRVNITINQA